MTAVPEMTWLSVVLWVVLLVLSQIWRNPDGGDGILALGSVVGFALALTMFREGQAVIGLVLVFVNLWVLYGAIESW